MSIWTLLFLLAFVAMIAMHLRGHGGHGGCGAGHHHDGHDSHQSGDRRDGERNTTSDAPVRGAPPEQHPVAAGGHGDHGRHRHGC